MPAAGTPRVQLLRSPALWADDAAAAQALQPAAAALLAVLALRGTAARDELAALLYPDAPRERQLTNLRQRLHQLRMQAKALLVIGRQDVALARGVRHDLAQPELALADDPEALPGDLLGSLDFSSSRPLADWVRRERLAWVGRRREILTRLATDREDAGQIAQALRYAGRLVADEPTHEHGVRLLMRLHYRRGDRGAALTAYEQCVQALHAQFGDAVADETAQLADAIARGAEEAPAPLQAMPVGLRHPPRLVGREALLSRALRSHQADGVVLLAGPAGIGKTRLFEALCERTATTHVVRLAAGEGDAPLGLLRRLLQALGRPPPAVGTPESLAAELRRCLLQAAAAAPAAGVSIGVEDLHFADPDSLVALTRMLPPVGPAGVRWCLTSRQEPLPDALAAWLDHQEQHAPLVELGEWTAAQLSAFVSSVGTPTMHPEAWAAALHRHCGGHPLHVLWVLRAVVDEGGWGRAEPPAELPHPAELRQRIARRLDGGDALAQQLAFVGALAGVDFDAALAARVTGRRAADLVVPWRRLEALGVLQGARFSHELVRLAVLEAVPVPLRPLLHAELAQALPDQTGVHERRAAHWLAADRPLQAAADLAVAAEHALELGLPARALELLERAERLHAAQGSAAAAFDLRWRAGRLAVSWDSPQRALDIAQALLLDARDDRQRALALTLRSHARTERHEAGALEDAAAALTLASTSGDAHARLQARLRRMAALYVAGRPAEALAEAEALRADHGDGLALQDQHELEDTRALALAALGRRREAVAAASAGRDRALQAGRWLRASELASTVSVQLHDLSELTAALAASEQAVDLMQRAGADRGVFHVDRMTLAGLYMDAGRFAEAVEVGESAAQGLREAGHLAWAVNADNSLASMFMVLGRHDLAARRLQVLPPDAPPWTRAAREMLCGVLLHRRSGDSPLAELQRARAIMAEPGVPSLPFVLHRIGAEAARWLPADEGLALLAEAEQWAEAREHEALRRIVRRQRVELLTAAGRGAQALSAAEALQADFAGRWEALNQYLPEVWRALVQAFDAAGRRPEGDAMARQAALWIRERHRTQVPAAFAHSFLNDNLCNRWMLARAGRHHASITIDS